MASGSMKGIFGEGGRPPPMDEPDGDEPAAEEESEYPPEYTAAYQEYEDAPSAETFWRAVEACTAASKPSSGGLALILGGPKGKGKK